MYWKKMTSILDIFHLKMLLQLSQVPVVVQERRAEMVGQAKTEE